VSTLRFFYGVTLDQPGLARLLTFVREPRASASSRAHAGFSPCQSQ
jgi:hypothetical protein